MTAPRGLITPFRRDRKRDFASDDGDALLGSKVLQVLATEGATPRSSGELPWRTAFGTPLQLLRHQNNDVALGELARIYVRDALRRWVTDAVLVGIDIVRADVSVVLRIRLSQRNVTTEVELPVLPAVGGGES